MVAPLIPTRKDEFRYITYEGNRYQIFQLISRGFKQKPPYVNTPFSSTCSWMHKGISMSGDWNNDYESILQSALVKATNQAKARFVSKTGDSASFGATLTAERKETWGTIVSGVTSVFSAARAVKKGQLVEAARHLGISPPIQREKHVFRRKKGRKPVRVVRHYLTLPNGKEVASSVANKWLWWSYGVKPLASDIYSAMDTLQHPPPETRVSGQSTVTVGIKEPDGPVSIGREISVKARVKVSASVRIKNPNLYLANQLGLTNPLQWAIEGIPFSFVVDWFSNLSQVVSQMTEFLGLEIIDPVTSSKSDMTRRQYWRGSSSPTTNFTVRYIRFSRTLTIPVAKLRFEYETFSFVRGANAISLLVGFLEKNKRHAVTSIE